MDRQFPHYALEQDGRQNKTLTKKRESQGEPQANNLGSSKPIVPKTGKVEKAVRPKISTTSKQAGR